ncbi:MAG: ABC transporter permease [Coriobacteriia bacterium]|nr:ABC transporter permease [Coriobacteriia bacterium]
MRTFLTILKDNWEWRRQIGRLAIFDLVKKTRGTALSWAWLWIQPLIFIGVFWFALKVGIRADKDMPSPYFLWLMGGLIPWFFMRDMIGGGSDILRRYSYLVTKIKFPLGGIPTIHAFSSLIIHLGLVVVLFAIYFLFGKTFDLYLLQIPLAIILMLAFFTVFSLMTSLLSALSKDFANLVKSFVTPLFWLSGIIFDLSKVDIPWVQTIMLFNPIAFFATVFRKALYYKTWAWEAPWTKDFSPEGLICFGIVFLLTLLGAVFLYRRLSREVPDAL